MKTKEIITYLKNEGGFQLFCNTERWSASKCADWVKKNFKCTKNAANVVGEEICGWT